jgi:hypothetical protein
VEVEAIRILISAFSPESKFNDIGDDPHEPVDLPCKALRGLVDDLVARACLRSGRPGAISVNVGHKPRWSSPPVFTLAMG